MTAGDLIVVSELSRIFRSVGQIIKIVDELIKNKIRLIAIKENIHLNGKQDIQSKMMVTLFGLFAEIERDFISERTCEGLNAARAKGRILGRPKGSRGLSRLDGKESEIHEFLEMKTSKSSIAKILDVSRSTLLHFIKSRKLQ
jgi:DNA invertase Pin-like site-specific DNA recombinase